MFHVRPAIVDDSSAIIDFQIKMAKETEEADLDRETVTSGVLSVFDDQQKGIYYVGEYNEKIVSSLMITKEWSDWRNQWIYWLQSVYVEPQFRARGLFRKMYAYIQKQVDDDPQASGIRLYVDISNLRALKVYSAIGMNTDHYQVCEWMKDY